MISNQDRSGWFGASDTVYICGNWNTKSFEKWWMVKLGLSKNNFQNKFTLAGTHYEHAILDALGIKLKKDVQIKIPQLKLRVNYDGVSKTENHEIKTYNLEKGFNLSKSYLQQAHVETFANQKQTIIHAYGLNESDYDNYFHPIDKEKILHFPIEYDSDFINNEYLPRLKHLRDCLINGVMPKDE